MGYIDLSEREEEVIEHIAAGLSAQQIADVLCISPRTVETYIDRIYSKTGALNRANAVMIWYTDRINSAMQREAERIQRRIEALTAITI